MSCVAKTSELYREELKVDGIPDVFASLTIRELARLIRLYG